MQLKTDFLVEVCVHRNSSEFPDVIVICFCVEMSNTTTLYDGCSNPTSTAGKDLLSDMTYKHLTASHVANLRSSSSIVVLPIRGSIIILPGGG